MGFCESVESVGDLGVKKDVIWRWAGSADAPAKGRFVRGADIFSVLVFGFWLVMILSRGLMELMGLGRWEKGFCAAELAGSFEVNLPVATDAAK